MGFWNLQVDEDKQAVVEIDGHGYTYHQLQAAVSKFKADLPHGRKNLGLVLCDNRGQDLIAYLAGLQHGDAVMLLDERMSPELLQRIITMYQPAWISTTRKLTNVAYEQWNNTLFLLKSDNEQVNIYPDLAVLLSTSGTTGSAKFVRLSYQNISENASSIAHYLKLDSTERPLANLPMSYSYGLSVINSHLLVGATLLMTKESVLSKEFWNFFHEQKATSLAGVPYTYQMLHRLRMDKMDLPSLRMFTQAGGRLSPKLIAYFYEVACQKAARFFVMYGQTEATARMSYVPFEQLKDKIGSIGIAIPKGQLSIEEETQELVYRGPNVMLGYAYEGADLAKGDELHGLLYTGDIATVDEDGYFSIVGRLNRFVKLFGLRVSLDEVEQLLEHQFQTTFACLGTDEKMRVVLEHDGLKQKIEEWLRQVYGLHHSSFRVEVVDNLPRLANGKLDYQRLKDT